MDSLTGRKLKPLDSERFGRWMYLSRGVQSVFALVIIGLDGAVIDMWNQNQVKVPESAPVKPDVQTWVGGTPFTGVVMFTAVLTLFVIIYDLTFPAHATIFYHVYGEIALELFLVILWVASFAGIGSYVSQTRILTHLLVSDSMDKGVAKNTKRSEIECGVIAISGAIVFAFALANSMTLIAFVVQNEHERARTAADRAAATAASPSPENMEKGVGQRVEPSVFHE
ncbi:MAG: hypothetical protein M1813_001240 [Trichoglossum hirsutum]|nr:MAG: hypothetical protein M1813_001240 [Trichoglossum hirsutum]